MRLKALIEKRAETVIKLRKFADATNAPDHEFSAEDQAQFDTLKADVGKYDGAIEREKKIDEMEAEALKSTNFNDARPAIMQDRPDAVTPQERRLAFNGWLMAGKNRHKLTKAHAQAMSKLGIDDRQPEMVIDLCDTESLGQLQEVWRTGTPDQRQALLKGRSTIGATGLLTSGATAGAGFIPPGTMATQIESALLNFGQVRAEAEIYRTSDNGPFKVPTDNDTGNTGELLAEQASIGSTTDPTISSKTYNLFKFSSKLVKFTAEMLQDSAFNLPSWLADKLGTRLARITNSYYTTGAGTTEPAGAVTGGTNGKTAASATTTTFDEILDLIESVDPSYREGAVFMFKSAVETLLRKLKDGDSAYMWSSNVQEANRKQLFGFRTIINQQMPAMTTGLKPILFGQLSKMKIRSLPEVRVRRLGELYAATDEEGMIAFIREDGGVLDAGTHPLKYMTMA